MYTFRVVNTAATGYRERERGVENISQDMRKRRVLIISLSECSCTLLFTWNSIRMLIRDSRVYLNRGMFVEDALEPVFCKRVTKSLKQWNSLGLALH